MKKTFILFSVLVCLVGFLQGALAASERPLVVGLPAGIPSLDPAAMSLTDSGLIIGRLVFESLFGIDEKGKIYPQLALSWKWVDENTLRVNLRKGVKFHNGEPFTASDVKFTIEWLMTPENKWNGIRDFASFDKVVIIDDYTIDFKYKRADPATLNHWAARVRIYSKKFFDKNGIEGLRNNAIGTGAFKFVSWKRDDQFIIEANDEWYLGKPKVKTIIFRFLPEMASRVAELQTGNVHIIPGLPPFMVTELKKVKGIDVQTELAVRAMFMDIDTIKVPELKDKRVRQALNYAVDKELIIKGVLSGMAQPLGTHVPVIIPGADPSIKPYPYDPEKARALLKEAGYPNGFSLDLFSSSGNHPMDKEVTLAVADQLSKSGH